MNSFCGFPPSPLGIPNLVAVSLYISPAPSRAALPPLLPIQPKYSIISFLFPFIQKTMNCHALMSLMNHQFDFSPSPFNPSLGVFGPLFERNPEITPLKTKTYLRVRPECPLASSSTSQRCFLLLLTFFCIRNYK